MREEPGNQTVQGLRLTLFAVLPTFTTKFHCWFKMAWVL